MEIIKMQIKNKKDFEELMKREDIPEDVKTDIEKIAKKVFLNKEAEKLYTATERFEKIYTKTFERTPSKFNEKQMLLYRKAFNKCSEVLEKLNKEMEAHE